MQRRERFVRRRALCRVHDGRSAAADRRRPVRRGGLPEWFRRAADAVRPMPSGSLRTRRPLAFGGHASRSAADDRGAARRVRTGGPAVSFSAVDVIRAKRDGAVLSDAQIDWVIDAYTRGAVADEQMAALAMAIFFN